MSREDENNASAYALFGFLILFALFLRVYQLDQVPRGFYWDEAANGYTSYSIMKTGRDLQGNLLPLFTDHHNLDYVEGLYTYLSIPFIYLFGLNVFSTRVLAAIIGTLTILSTYLLTTELYNRKVALIAAAILALSPAHLLFSRVAFRGVLLPLFITLGLFFLLKGLKRPGFFIPGFVAFGLCLHTYSTAKVFVPLALAVFLAFYYREIRAAFKPESTTGWYLALSCLMFLVLAAPIYYFSFFGGGNKRFDTISVFATSSQPLQQFVVNLLSHLSPGFLFINGDANLRHSVPGFGQLLPVLLPFILIAIGLFIYRKNREGLFLLSLFIIGIVPASLTNEGLPHSLRSISTLPFLEIVAAVGIFSSIEYFRGNRGWASTLIMPFIGLAFFINAALFTHTYFKKYPSVSQDYFHRVIQQAVSFSVDRSKEYDHIVVSERIRPVYIFLLFFARVDPALYQSTGTMGKYVLCSDIQSCYKQYRTMGRTLVIAAAGAPVGQERVKYFYSAEGIPVLKVAQ